MLQWDSTRINLAESLNFKLNFCMGCILGYYIVRYHVSVKFIHEMRVVIQALYTPHTCIIPLGLCLHWIRINVKCFCSFSVWPLNNAYEKQPKWIRQYIVNAVVASVTIGKSTRMTNNVIYYVKYICWLTISVSWNI